jgi:uncharacterized protein (DUF362 family)
MKNAVFFARGDARYPRNPREWQESPVGSLLRRLFSAWGLDPANPFGDYVRRGQVALLKPNWVNHRHPLNFGLDALVTHPSLVAAMLDLVAIAMNGEGTVIIGDAPIQSTDFRALCEQLGLDDIVAGVKAKYPRLKVLIEDWRLTVMERGTGESGKGSQRTVDQSDATAAGSHRLIDLGTNSFLEELSDYSSRFRVTNYRPSLMRSHHAPGVHQYLITTRVDSDFTLNLPKMKTHMKAGLTGALKNSVGINGHKEYLPHHITGPYGEGGDNYPAGNRWWNVYERMYDEHWEAFHELSPLKKKISDTLVRIAWAASQAPRLRRVSAGSWSGNDTVWRTTLDLSNTWYFERGARRNILTIVDGIVAGEGLGPLTPTPKPIGVILGGENPASIDAAIAQMIGYNVARVPTVYNALFHRRSGFSVDSIEDIAIVEALRTERRELAFSEVPRFNFKLPDFWERAGLGPDARSHRAVAV